MSAARILLVLLALYAASVAAALLWPLTYWLRGKEVVRAATQSVNAALGGLARESFSSRMGRLGDWPRVRAWVDTALPGHTADAAEREAHVVRMVSGE